MTTGPGTDGRAVGFGVIGANSFVANAAVLPAIVNGHNTRLVAAASRGGEVPADWLATDVGSYEAVLEHPDVDAVYIPLPNGMHQEWTERAAAAGKHVLCEKPLASDAATARAMYATCIDADVLLAEAWMTPFSERYQHVLEVARSGTIGDLRRIDSSFTFTIGPGNEDNYRWDPTQGGGALLDVGIYCLGPIVELFDGRPDGIDARLTMTERGVDAAVAVDLVWHDGRSAGVVCSFVDDETQTLHITGSRATVHVDDEAFTGGVHATGYGITDANGATDEQVTANDPYRAMVEAFADAVEHRTEWPRHAERSIEMLQLTERIRDAAHN